MRSAGAPALLASNPAMFSRNRPRPRRTWPQRILLLLGVVVIAASVSTALALDYGDEKVGELPRVELGAVLAADPETSDEAQNFLLVGVDSIASLDPDDPLRIGREEENLLTDTLILLRVEPETGDATMLSLPRDLWVPIAGAGYEQKVNAAMSIGGPDTLVQTVSEALDIPIHHFVQVDFRGFREVIDVIGGVPVWFEIPMRDPRVGFLVEEPGCHVLDANESLKFVRSRSMQGQLEEGRWEYLDLTPDLGRIDRQQEFLISAMRKAIAKGGLRHPGTSVELIDAGIGSVTIDELLTPRDLVNLADQFSGFRPDDLDKSTLPVYDDIAGGLEILRIQEAGAQPLLERFRGVGGELSEEGVRIAVLNGTGAPGLADEVAAELSGAGFTPTRTEDADVFDYPNSQLRFHADDREEAELLLRYMDNAPELVEVLAVVDARLELIVGADWAGLSQIPDPPSESVPGDEQVTPTPTAEVTTAPSPLPVDDGITDEEGAVQEQLEAERQACIG